MWRFHVPAVVRTCVCDRVCTHTCRVNGAGLRVRALFKGGHKVIDYIEPGGAAESNGSLEIGDVIMGVDGIPAEKLTVDDIESILTGQVRPSPLFFLVVPDMRMFVRCPRTVRASVCECEACRGAKHAAVQTCLNAQARVPLTHATAR